MPSINWNVVREVLAGEAQGVFDRHLTKAGLLPQTFQNRVDSMVQRAQLERIVKGIAPGSVDRNTFNRALFIFDQTDLHGVTGLAIDRGWRSTDSRVNEKLRELHSLTGIPPVLTSGGLGRVQALLREFTVHEDGALSHHVVPWLGMDLERLHRHFAAHNGAGTSGGSPRIHQGPERPFHHARSPHRRLASRFGGHDDGLVLGGIAFAGAEAFVASEVMMRVI